MGQQTHKLRHPLFNTPSSRADASQVQQQHGRLLDQVSFVRMNRNERSLLNHRSYLLGTYRELLHVELRFLTT